MVLHVLHAPIEQTFKSTLTHGAKHFFAELNLSKPLQVAQLELFASHAKQVPEIVPFMHFFLHFPSSSKVS